MGELRIEATTGHRCVEVLSSLLQRARVAAPARRGWEAADLQWWWRRACTTDDTGRLLARSSAGDVVGAVVFTDLGSYCQVDVPTLPGLGDDELAQLWALAARRIREWEGSALEVLVDVHDEAFVGPVLTEGMVGSDEPYHDAWLAASDRPRVPALPAGYELRDQATAPTSPHPFVRRNGADVAARLAENSLYDAALDLYVVAPDGTTCAYGLFWPDPITRVGLVEPMRTEEGHEHQGIASHVLASGLDRLAARGCTRLKVSSDGPLYARAGFAVGATARTLRASP